MKKYIDAEKATKALEKELKSLASEVNHNYREGLQFALKLLNEQSAADVQEVVRCKDCANVIHRNDTTVVCKILNKIMITDDFCSYGARKETDE